MVYDNGAYYSIKEKSVYKLSISSDDLVADNKVFRVDIGVPSWKSLVQTRDGIVFMDTSRVERPQLTILASNVYENLEPVLLAQQFDFSKYTWTDCAMEAF